MLMIIVMMIGDRDKHKTHFSSGALPCLAEKAVGGTLKLLTLPYHSLMFNVC